MFLTKKNILYTPTLEPVFFKYPCFMKLLESRLLTYEKEWFCDNALCTLTELIFMFPTIWVVEQVKVKGKIYVFDHRLYIQS